MPPCLGGSGICMRSSTRSGLGAMSGILPGVQQPKQFADPGFTSIPSISAQCTLPSLASLFWLLYKIELSFRQEIETKVFTAVPSPRRALVGSAPKTKHQVPQMEIWNTINHWNFYQISISSPPGTNVKPPHTNVKSP